MHKCVRNVLMVFGPNETSHKQRVEGEVMGLIHCGCMLCIFLVK